MDIENVNGKIMDYSSIVRVREQMENVDRHSDKFPIFVNSLCQNVGMVSRTVSKYENEREKYFFHTTVESS